MTKQQQEVCEQDIFDRWAEIGDIRAAGSALLADNYRLRQALIDYGEHDAGCYMRYTEHELTRTKWTPEMIANRRCTCGLSSEIDPREE